jgi:hypothetical protein
MVARSAKAHSAKVSASARPKGPKDPFGGPAEGMALPPSGNARICARRQMPNCTEVVVGLLRRCSSRHRWQNHGCNGPVRSALCPIRSSSNGDLCIRKARKGRTARTVRKVRDCQGLIRACRAILETPKNRACSASRSSPSASGEMYSTGMPEIQYPRNA